MHKPLLLPAIVLMAVIIGGLLYLYGGPSFHQTYKTSTDGSSASTFSLGNVELTVLAEGQQAIGEDERTNYRVQNQEQLAALWQMAHTNDDNAVPPVDFDKYEVLALFDGSHSTGGYGINITSVKDTSDARVVTIVHTEPGDSCVPPGGGTSPFVVIELKKSPLPISRVDQSVTTQCE